MRGEGLKNLVAKDATAQGVTKASVGVVAERGFTTPKSNLVEIAMTGPLEFSIFGLPACLAELARGWQDCSQFDEIHQRQFRS